MVKHIIHYFDKLEDRIRGRLSRYPLIYTLIGGITIVLFWRGVWITADQFAAQIPQEFMWIDGPLSVMVSGFILLVTGLFVSFFVNDTTIITGMKQEKKMVQETEAEVKEEGETLKHIENQLHNLEDTLKEMGDQSPKQ